MLRKQIRPARDKGVAVAVRCRVRVLSGKEHGTGMAPQMNIFCIVAGKW